MNHFVQSTFLIRMACSDIFKFQKSWMIIQRLPQVLKLWLHRQKFNFKNFYIFLCHLKEINGWKNLTQRIFLSEDLTNQIANRKLSKNWLTNQKEIKITPELFGAADSNWPRACIQVWHLTHILRQGKLNKTLKYLLEEAVLTVNMCFNSLILSYFL